MLDGRKYASAHVRNLHGLEHGFQRVDVVHKRGMEKAEFLICQGSQGFLISHKALVRFIADWA